MFSLHPAPSPPLRTLTLGVLVVSGGTLLALPFRRHPATPDASVAPAALSGPSQSALDTTLEPQSRQTTAIADNTLDSLPVWNPTPVVRQSRQLDIPLTYEDLALPIDQPAAIEQRFSATARVQEKKEARRRESAMVMPSLESLTLQQREQMETLPTPETYPDENRAGGRLASSAASRQSNTNPQVTANPQANTGFQADASNQGPSFQAFPALEPEAREHHWIQQP